MLRCHWCVRGALLLFGLPFLVAGADDGTSGGVNVPLRLDGRPVMSEAEWLRLEGKKAAWATFREKDFTTMTLPPCPGSPATLGAGSTSADLNAILSDWETADATAQCSGVLTFTAPTATTYTLAKRYVIDGGSSWTLDASLSGGVTIVAAADNRHLDFWNGGTLALQGLTFTGGDSSSYDMDTLGGSISVYLATVRIISCVFRGNIARSNAGAIVSDYSDMFIAASLFENNSSPAAGGAIQTFGGNYRIVDSIFRGNTAAVFAGGLGIYGYQTTLHVSGTVFEGNTAPEAGAVDIFAYEPGDDPFDVSFVDCVFKNNGKWAIWQENSENIFSVVRCTFENNDDNDVEAYGPFTCLSSCPAVTAPPNQCDCAFTAAPTPAPTPSTDVSYVAAQGIVCMPEEYLDEGRRRRGLQEEAKNEMFPAKQQAAEEHRILLSDPAPQTCYDACKALLAPDSNFVYNIYPETGGDLVCTCCRSCTQTRALFGAEVYGLCFTGPTYYKSVAAKANRKVARPKTMVTYTVRVKPTAQARDPYILQVALPRDTTYVKGRATGLKVPPVISKDSSGATLVTWSSVSPRKLTNYYKPTQRAFIVKARINAGVAKGTTLAFAGTVYQTNQLTNNGTVCGRLANAITVTVK